MDRKKIIKAVGIFFGIMLAFTILSRAAIGITSAVVETTYVSAATIYDENFNSERYEHCVPVTALHLDNNGYYVYRVDIHEGRILGEQLIASKIPVSIVAKDDYMAALDNLDWGEVVISSDRIVKEGCHLRRAGE